MDKTEASTNPTGGAFDRRSLLYPLLMNYMASLVGYQALSLFDISRSIKAMDREELDKLVEMNKSNGDTFKLRQIEIMRDVNPSELFPDFQLPSNAFNGSTVMSIKDVEHEFSSNAQLGTGNAFISGFLSVAMASLLVSAYEKVKDYTDHSELWEFFRHCRHASAHNGVFTFRGNEPKRPAKWARFSITKAMEGTPVFHTPVTPAGLLSVGDPLRLLFDIEQATPALIQPV